MEASSFIHKRRQTFGSTILHIKTRNRSTSTITTWKWSQANWATERSCSMHNSRFEAIRELYFNGLRVLLMLMVGGRQPPKFNLRTSITIRLTIVMARAVMVLLSSLQIHFWDMISGQKSFLNNTEKTSCRSTCSRFLAILSWFSPSYHFFFDQPRNNNSREIN